jgi:hypothetical protein
VRETKLELSDYLATRLDASLLGFAFSFDLCGWNKLVDHFHEAHVAVVDLDLRAQIARIANVLNAHTLALLAQGFIDRLLDSRIMSGALTRLD